ncbi:hypothetical protein BH11MYX3_BH11MYX3_08140 [soil metagenome]
MAPKLLLVPVMIRRCAASALLLAALVAPAAAQPGADQPPTPAPMTDRWEDVSHINGQLVKVGERNEYLIKDPKRFNISTNPIGFLVGFYGLSVAGAITDNIVIRGNVELFDYEFFGRTTGHELAISAPLYLRRAFSGPFLEPGFIYQQTMDTPWDLFGDGDQMPVAHTYAGPEILFGWHWTFDSGLNFAAALGVTRSMNTTSSNSDEYQSDEPMPTGYLRVGYAF